MLSTVLCVGPWRPRLARLGVLGLSLQIEGKYRPVLSLVSATFSTSCEHDAAIEVAAQALMRNQANKDLSSPAAHIWRHFHPTTKASTRKMVGVLNNSEASPSNLAYVVLTLGEHPHWHGQDTIYVKSRLELLPEYAEKKAQLVEQHKEPSHEEKMERIIAQMTESINFKRYGIEDGPDVECYDNQGNCKSIIVPGDWMSKAYELPEIAGCVDTPSVKYRPAEAEAIAVYACRKWDEGYFFVAWFVIEEIELFAANSLALAYMAHDKKWYVDETTSAPWSDQTPSD